MRDYAIITGAGSGIGREFVKLFAADGVNVLAVSLLQSELDELKRDVRLDQGELLTLRMDLSDAGAAEALLAYCDEQKLNVSSLVNNAGFACFGEVVEENVEKLMSMIALNVTTLTKLSLLFGARMKKQGNGRILNVGSTAGMIPAPKMAAYSGSKAYVNSFTVALAAELKPYGVFVTCLAPGATQTKFADAGGITDFKGSSSLKTMFAERKAGSPADVAAAGYKGLMAGKNFVLTGKGAKIALLMSRILPLASIPNIIANRV